MAGGNMLSTDKVKQKSTEAVYYTFWCYSSYNTQGPWNLVFKYQIFQVIVFCNVSKHNIDYS